MLNHNSIIVLGTTASGKTKIAAHLASLYHGEIISADSRQVYKQLNIGAGKDYEEYNVNHQLIRTHLIDVADIENTFFLKDYLVAANIAIRQIKNKEKLPIICGGTGLYLDALLKNFQRIFIPQSNILRIELEKFSKDELIERLKISNSKKQDTFDLRSRKRLIRAIEIMESHIDESDIEFEHHTLNPLIIGLTSSIVYRKNKISTRLENRFKMGLVEEVESLINMGYTHQQLQFLGLEYKFVSMYLNHEIKYNEMKTKLETAIFQFAKRQATWFRKMEREGFKINWIDTETTFENIIQQAQNVISSA